MSNSKFKFLCQQTALVSLMSMGLIACGGGSGSSTSPTPVTVTPPAPTGTTFSLDGATVKGLILGGAVSVSDASDASSIIGTGTTSTVDGTYSLTVPDTANFEGPFVKVTVTGGANALMVCDSGDGCSDIAGTAVSFGDTFAIGSNVSLSAIAPTPVDNGSAVVNLSIFSDLAATLVEESSANVNSDILNDANAQVANLFGLTSSNLTAIAPTNLASTADTSTDSNALRAGVLSGGALSAAFENGPDIGIALNELRRDFGARGGQLILNEATDDPALISLEDILGGALNSANESGISSEEFGLTKAEILGESIAAGSSEAGAVTTANVAPSNDAPALEQAKAFVSDIQLIVEAVKSDENEDNFVDFADRVEAAGELLADDAETAFKTALDGADAIARAYEAYQNDNSLTLVEANGLTVNISSQSGDLVLDIAPQMLRNETIQMTVVGDLDIETVETDSFDQTDDGTETNSEYITTITIGGDTSLTSLVENAAVKLEILNGDVSVVGGQSNENFVFEGISNFDDNVTNTQGIGSQIILAERVSANLDIKLSQKADQGLAFNGQASVSSVAPKFEDSSFFLETFRPNLTEILNTSSFNASLSDANISFSGSLNEGGQFIDLTFALQGEGDSLELSTETDEEEYSSFSVSDNVLTRESGPFTRTFELVTNAEMQTELENLVANGAEVTVFESGTITYSIDDELIAAIRTPDTDNLILRSGGVNTDTQEDNLLVFLQAETLGLFGTPDPTEAFIANPPSDIIDFYNGGFIVTEGVFSIRCSDNPILVESRFLDPDGGVITGIPLVQSRSPNVCDGGGSDFNFFTTDQTASLDAEASVSALMAASVRQNIAGIDEDDTLVTASFFGPINYNDEEVSGNLTLKLEFAGRTFQTDARNIDVFTDLSQPVTITNQDGVVMIISENTDGLATGSVMLDGEQFGAISEENGIVLVTYTDDTFVSIK